MSDEISLARGWTLEAYVAHNEAMRGMSNELDAEREKRSQETDRRYHEVATEREKALKIKETADLAALGLAREIQTYKDEKANELRSQIERERGTYATQTDLVGAVAKIDATYKPVADYVTGQQGGPRALTTGSILAGLAALGVGASLWLSTHRTVQQPAASTVTVIATTTTAP